MTKRSDDFKAKARELLGIVKTDPVHAITGCSVALMQLEQERQEDLNHLVAVPFAVAGHLLTDWDAWVQFINTPEL